MTASVMARKPLPGCPVDPVIAGIAAFLLLYGFIMVGSASLEIGVKTYGNAFHLLTRHGLYLGLSVLAALAAVSVPIRVWQKISPVLPILSLVVLAVVLVPGIGREVNGATRWIVLGPFSFQGSEFVKLLVMVYLAGHLARCGPVFSPGNLVKPLLVLALVSLLLLGQPDLGTAVIIVVAAIGMIFLAGLPWRFFLPLVTLCAVMVVLIATLQPYRLARLSTFADPWQHQFGSGYQLTQALIAFGRGEWVGLGLGNSIQKLFFLPEAHTDFLFSIVAEELGIVGAGLIIVLFTWLMIRGLAVGNAARGKGLMFHACLAWGITLVLGIQASVNLGVNLGVLPTTGMTLPLMSYGGNSLIVSCVMIAILLRVDFETRYTAAGKRGGRRNG